jgi:hypothetical protein
MQYEGVPLSSPALYIPLMGFRKWLLNEDPDFVELGSGEQDYCSWRDEDSLCFIVWRGGFAHAYGASHIGLYTLVAQGLRNKKNSIGLKGAPPVVQGIDIGNNDIAYAGVEREKMMPHMLLGRAWVGERCDNEDDPEGGAKRRVLSFWNPPAQVYAHRKEIFEMIRDIGSDRSVYDWGSNASGDPRDYQYEVQGRMMGYDEFVGGAVKKANPLFDPSKVHTMLPGPVKGQLMGAMGFMRSKPVDVRTRAAREGD